MAAARFRKDRGRASGDWAARWLEACADLAELERSNPTSDAVIEEVDGRMIRIGDRWLGDFASCNDVGFDLERETIALQSAERQAA
jgi:8-amino-7-oxononanoate synthase